MYLSQASRAPDSAKHHTSLRQLFCSVCVDLESFKVESFSRALSTGFHAAYAWPIEEVHRKYLLPLILNFYLFMAMLGLRFCARALSSCGKWGPFFIAVRGPLTIMASLVAEHRLQTRRLSSCGSWAQLLRGTWDPPRPGPEPVSPALAGRLSTTAPPGKPTTFNF